jgi:hypothetical protein
MYKFLRQKDGSISNETILRDDGVFIPFDNANIDYQAYLKWLSEGNTPLPPDQE